MEITYEEVDEEAWTDERKGTLKDCSSLMPRVEGNIVTLIHGRWLTPHALVVSDSFISVAYQVILDGKSTGALFGLVKRGSQWIRVGDASDLTDEQLFSWRMAVHNSDVFSTNQPESYSNPAYSALEALIT